MMGDISATQADEEQSIPLLGQFIHRFRNAAPAPASERTAVAPRDAFWWLNPPLEPKSSDETHPITIGVDKSIDFTIDNQSTISSIKLNLSFEKHKDFSSVLSSLDVDDDADLDNFERANILMNRLRKEFPDVSLRSSVSEQSAADEDESYPEVHDMVTDPDVLSVDSLDCAAVLVADKEAEPIVRDSLDDNITDRVGIAEMESSQTHQLTSETDELCDPLSTVALPRPPVLINHEVRQSDLPDAAADDSSGLFMCLSDDDESSLIHSTDGNMMRSEAECRGSSEMIIDVDHRQSDHSEGGVVQDDWLFVDAAAVESCENGQVNSLSPPSPPRTEAIDSSTSSSISIEFSDPVTEAQVLPFLERDAHLRDLWTKLCRVRALILQKGN